MHDDDDDDDITSSMLVYDTKAIKIECTKQY